MRPDTAAIAHRLATRILPVVALTACAQQAPDPGPSSAEARLLPGTQAADGHVLHVEWSGTWTADLALVLDGYGELPTAQSGRSPTVLRARIPQGRAGVQSLGIVGEGARLGTVRLTVDRGLGDRFTEELHPGSPADACDGGQVRVCTPLTETGACTVPRPHEDSALQDLVAYATDLGIDGPLQAVDVRRETDFDRECCVVLDLVPAGTGGSGAGVLGRPFTVAEQPRTAALRPGTDWATAPFADHGLTPEQRALAARHWTRAALAEHASVASFARFQLELLGLGAPADLLVRTAKAQIDEAEHARFAFALAGHLGAAVSPGPLPLDHALGRASDVEAILVGAVLEGCIEETLAAAEMRVAATSAHVDLRARLNQIAEDETRHAELSWAFVRWLLGERPELRPLAARTFASATVGPRPEDDGPGLEAVGLLGPQLRWSLRRSVFQQVIGPAVGELLAR